MPAKIGASGANKMTFWEVPITDDQDAEQHPYYVPRPEPLPIPEAGVFDAPYMCLRINSSWASHLLGVLEVLDQPDAWIGTDEEIEAARNQVRELIAKLGEVCMDDPCCPEGLELAEQANITALQDLYNEYQNQNAQQAMRNQGLYDGTNESLYYNAGANFDSNGDGILCSAVDNFLSQIIAFVAARTALAAALIGVGASAAIAALVAMGVFTGGASIVAGVVLGASLAVAMADVEEAWNNTTAQKKVKCCMFEALTGQALTPENFATSLDSCDFDEGSPEERIRSGIAPMLAELANYEAFLTCLNMAQNGGTENCDCECDVDEIILIGVTPETTVTKLTSTTWQVFSTYMPNDDPARPDARNATVRDQFNRCVNFVSSSQGMVDGVLRDCDNVDVPSLGFPAGNGVRVTFRQDAEDIDTVLTIACP